MVMSLPSLKVTVFFICLCFNMVSFRGQKKLGPRPDRSPLGILFKTSDEHPHPFHMRIVACRRVELTQSFRSVYATSATEDRGLLYC